MGRNYIPTRDSLLVPFTTNFAEQLTAKFAQVGRTSADATAFAALNTAWVNAYATAIEPSTRTRSAIQLKDAAKRACVSKLRELGALIQKFSGTTDALRVDFGLLIPDPRTPIPAPSVPPVLEVIDRLGTDVTIRLHDGTARRSRPKGVQGARVYSFVGATPPTEPSEWFEEGQTTRADVLLNFSNTLPAGTKVWLLAAWYNPRGQIGPACSPVSTVLAGGAYSLAA
jgi:hypothetical protein